MKKTLKELLIIGSILGILYVTGLHTELASFTQRIALNTGLFNDSGEMPESAEYFDYSQVLKGENGELTSMEELKGKVIFLNLWASWCGPCRAEMPGIESIYADLKEEEDIAFIMLSVDRNENAAWRFMSRMKFDFPSYVLGNQITQQLRVPSIPTTFVIGTDGKILRKKVGMANYDTKAFRKFLMDQRPERGDPKDL